MEDLHKFESDDFIIVKGARVKTAIDVIRAVTVAAEEAETAVAAIEAKDAVHSEEWKVGEDDFNQTLDTVPLAACSSV